MEVDKMDHQPQALHNETDTTAPPSSADLPIRLANNPQKMPRYPEGTKLHRRPIPSRLAPSASQTIFVSARTSFASIVTRARKRLDTAATTKGLPLAAGLARSAAMRAAGEGDEVKVVGTGRAIEKTLKVAAWFGRQGGYQVSVRTRTVGVIDDVLLEDDAMDTGEGLDSRVRRVSCLEVGLRLR